MLSFCAMQLGSQLASYDIAADCEVASWLRIIATMLVGQHWKRDTLKLVIELQWAALLRLLLLLLGIMTSGTATNRFNSWSTWWQLQLALTKNV